MTAIAYHNPSPALRRLLEAHGVEPLTPIWHRAAFYEQPGNIFPIAECVARAIVYVLRDPDLRFSWCGDAHSGTFTCQVPGCPDPHVFTRRPWDDVHTDRILADHWDAHHREEYGP